jgi:hypothetical protein
MEYEYLQFKNYIISYLYGELPSYAYFYDANLDEDLNEGYWNGFTYDEASKILIYFSKKYMDTNISPEKIKAEKWDPSGVLITLLLDYF